MPELPEVEAYRRALSPLLPAEVVRARARRPFDIPAPQVGLGELLARSRLVRVRRHGKVLLVDLDVKGGRPTTLALSFGMTGVVLIDGRSTIGALYFGPRRFDPAWVRLEVELEDGTSVAVSDPRGLGHAALDPALDRLGPDVLQIEPSDLAERIRRRRGPLKSALLDQRVVAGIGNLLADQALWQADLSPRRPAECESAEEANRLAIALQETVAQAIANGGSHTGPLVPERRPDGLCPKDGRRLAHGSVGGRSTWWCPAHQT
jgi:formamidopyrimidine-DNA glycosylase